MSNSNNSSSNSGGKLGFIAVWSMAAGGMVGGGIYTALGVVVSVSAQWAWLSFVLAGVVAATTGFSYVFLANKFGKGGGSFEFLREINEKGAAGSLSWLLVIGYVLTMAVYAFAFGHYLSYAFGTGAWVTRGLAVGIMAGLVILNLQGVSKTTIVEIIIVWGNLIILIALAGVGLWHWQPAQLVAGIEPRAPWAVPIGAASIFMAYEGFQLLAYDYDEVNNPGKIMMPAILSAIFFVIAIYIAVALGATMLAGALPIVDEKQVALSLSAQAAAGTYGLVAITLAAGFATAAAINSTLFSTAKLCKRVADDGELPTFFDHRNAKGIPDRAVITLGALAAILAVIGSLSSLVEAASLAFLFTFGTVNIIAAGYAGGKKWIPYTGTVVAGLIGVALLMRLAITAPLPLAAIFVFGLIAMFGRPAILKYTK